MTEIYVRGDRFFNEFEEETAIFRADIRREVRQSPRILRARRKASSINSTYSRNLQFPRLNDLTSSAQSGKDGELSPASSNSSVPPSRRIAQF